MVLADGPIAYYRLGDDDNTTTALDLAAGVNGTYVGAAPVSAPGTSGSPDTARSFNGTDQYVQLPANTHDFTTGVTLEAWARFTTNANYGRILDLGSGPETNNIVLTREGTTNHLRYEVHNGSLQVGLVASGAISGEWQHVVVTHAAAGLATIYIDGAAVASGPVSMPQAGTRTTNFIAESNWSFDDFFAGDIDDVSVYTRALTATEVTEHFRAAR